MCMCVCVCQTSALCNFQKLGIGSSWHSLGISGDLVTIPSHPVPVCVCVWCVLCVCEYVCRVCVLGGGGGSISQRALRLPAEPTPERSSLPRPLSHVNTARAREREIKKNRKRGGKKEKTAEQSEGKTLQTEALLIKDHRERGRKKSS